MILRTASFLVPTAVLFLTACDPVEERAGPPNGLAYVATQTAQRRNPNPSPEVHRWLAASDSVRNQLSVLRTELAGLQQLHVENHFDNFLSLDPGTLDAAQLCYLEHFLEHGYFRIEREILIQLLGSRRARAATRSIGKAPPADIAARLQASLQRDETLLIDLESAIAGYRAAGGEPLQIPAILTESQLDGLRVKVTAGLTAERAKIAELDAASAALRQQPVP